MMFHITVEDGEAQSEDSIDAPLGLEEHVKATVDEEAEYLSLLIEYRYVFAWTYSEMLGLNPKVVVHHLAIKKGSRSVKQGQRLFRPELVPSIEEEFNSLINADFIREAVYPMPLHGHEALNFMDGSSGYNQIRIDPTDEELTACHTLKRIYFYKVMSFGLKNAGATYQRSMQKIFDDMFHKNVECYVDDLVVKYVKRKDHPKDLHVVFERLRRYQLKMNPLKCTFGVASGKFLGLVVRRHGIEIEQTKIDAIMALVEPHNIHELKILEGKLVYLRRFISNLARKSQPFSTLMKNGTPFTWDAPCSAAFQDIMSYLMSPPVLAAPTQGKPLILYIAA
ncbi:hypothetical protein LIER_41976 [Lithospermum erythrorhizon]|uniref:Reverse transcriptase domain-containing protein n=1 Tax=Lithospermum erythrorhizon TaxID=34254 RepID=A0AAV3RNB1_LITER